MNIVFNTTVVPAVKFTKSKIKVKEDNGLTQPVLVLSNPSSTDITISVFSTDGSATGKDTLLPSTLTPLKLQLIIYRRRC